VVPVGDVVFVVVVLDLVVVVLVFVVVEPPELPLFGTYLMPLVLHDPLAGASTGLENDL
jgi:hypothetical protein